MNFFKKYRQKQWLRHMTPTRYSAFFVIPLVLALRNMTDEQKEHYSAYGVDDVFSPEYFPHDNRYDATEFLIGGKVLKIKLQPADADSEIYADDVYKVPNSLRLYPYPRKNTILVYEESRGLLRDLLFWTELID